MIWADLGLSVCLVLRIPGLLFHVCLFLHLYILNVQHIKDHHTKPHNDLNPFHTTPSPHPIPSHLLHFSPLPLPLSPVTCLHTPPLPLHAPAPVDRERGHRPVISARPGMACHWHGWLNHTASRMSCIMPNVRCATRAAKKTHFRIRKKGPNAVSV